MTLRFYCGVDPGLSGALALYDPVASLLMVSDMPTMEMVVAGKKRRRVDLYALARWADVHGPTIIKATIELVHTMPGQGVASSGAFMRAFGNVEAMIVSAFVPTEYISPNKWKKDYGLSADKEESRALATKLLPAFADRWARKKDDGRAEATLLAVYGYNKDRKIAA